MKRSRIMWSLCLTLLVGTMAQAAPKPAKPALLDEIRVSTDDGGHGGAHGGGGSSWTLRSNDTMDASESVSTFDAVAGGAEGFSHVNGAMQPGSFAQMLSYLQWTRLLNLKVPKPEGEQSGVTISLVRAGKAKSVRLTSESGAAANAAIWTTLSLVQSLETGIDWKNARGLSLSTGLFIKFASHAEGLPEFTSVVPPVVTVRDSKGEKVGLASVHSMAWADTLVLAPGTYSLTLRTFDVPEGYVWRAAPATGVVGAGKMTEVNIVLQKTPVAP